LEGAYGRFNRESSFLHVFHCGNIKWSVCDIPWLRLFILGVSGEASLMVDSKTVKAQLINASPGLFFMIGGVIIIILASHLRGDSFKPLNLFLDENL
jgi:hypothetical protein